MVDVGYTYLMNSAAVTVSGFEGMRQVRVEMGVLVAVGITSKDWPETWTVTRLARGACRGFAGNATLGNLREGLVGDRTVLDAKKLAGIIKAARDGRV